MRALTVVAVLATSALVAPVAMAGDRDAARRFARAATNAQHDIAAVRASADARMASRFGEECWDLIERAPRDPAVRDAASALTVALAVDEVLRPALPRLRAFVAGLRRVRVRDGSLAAGRSAWLKEIVAIEAMPAPPRESCAGATRWAQAGYPPGAPPVDPAAVFEVSSRMIDLDRPIYTAARRLERLGAPRRGAVAFTTDGLLMPRPAGLG